MLIKLQEEKMDEYQQRLANKVNHNAQTTYVQKMAIIAQAEQERQQRQLQFREQAKGGKALYLNSSDEEYTESESDEEPEVKPKPIFIKEFKAEPIAIADITERTKHFENLWHG